MLTAVSMVLPEQAAAYGKAPSREAQNATSNRLLRPPNKGPAPTARATEADSDGEAMQGKWLVVLRIIGTWAKEVTAVVDHYSGMGGGVGAKAMVALIDASSRRVGAAINAQADIPAKDRKEFLSLLTQTTQAMLQVAASESLSRGEPTAPLPPEGVPVAAWREIRRVYGELEEANTKTLKTLIFISSQNAVTEPMIRQMQVQVEHSYAQAGASIAALKGLDPSARRAVLLEVDTRRKAALQAVAQLGPLLSPSEGD